MSSKEKVKKKHRNTHLTKNSFLYIIKMLLDLPTKSETLYNSIPFLFSFFQGEKMLMCTYVIDLRFGEISKDIEDSTHYSQTYDKI